MIRLSRYKSFISIVAESLFLLYLATKAQASAWCCPRPFRPHADMNGLSTHTQRHTSRESGLREANSASAIKVGI